jgi:SAM-dependent methyltransferase
MNGDEYQKALAGEVSFWRQFRDVYPQLFASGMDPDAPLDADVEVAAIAQRSRRSKVFVLDVGCGMISGIGRKPRHQSLVPDMRFTYTDILAKVYQKIASEQGFVIPHDICDCQAESLARRFRAMFGIVYSRNAVDHFLNPIRSLQNMASVLVPGGYMILKHYERCGKINGYAGLHQWDFFIRDDCLWIAGNGEEHQVDALLAPLHTIRLKEYQDDGRPMVAAVYRKPL